MTYDDRTERVASPVSETAALELFLAPGLPGRWDVIQKGVDKPLASFNTNHDAMAYACKLATLKKEATVKAFSRDLRTAVTVQINEDRFPRSNQLRRNLVRADRFHPPRRPASRV